MQIIKITHFYITVAIKVIKHQLLAFQEYKFAEVRLFDVDVTLAVVTRTRREQFVVGKRGGKFTSSVDQRILFAIKPTTFKSNTEISIDVRILITVGTTLHVQCIHCLMFSQVKEGATKFQV